MPKNYFKEYDPEDLNDKVLDIPRQRLKIKHEERVLDNIYDLLRKLEFKLKNWETSDYSIETGTTGIALLYFHLYKLIHFYPLLRKSYLLFVKSWPHYLHSHQGYHAGSISFLKGESGILAVGVIVCNEFGRKEESDKLMNLLVNLHETAIRFFNPCDLEDLGGYLYSLLLVNYYLGNELIPKFVIQKVVETILKEGIKMAKFLNTPCPLWFCKNGIYKPGVLDGISGILLTLLIAKKFMSLSHLNKFLEPTIHYVRKQQFSSRKIFANLRSRKDNPVQWCDGAVGIIHLMAEAYKQFEETDYLQACDNCAKIIWKKGNKKISGGLYDGIVGASYAHLTMYQLTDKEEFFYRAHKSAQFCSEVCHPSFFNDKKQISFLNGLTGVIFLMADLIDPMNAAFPGITLIKYH